MPDWRGRQESNLHREGGNPALPLCDVRRLVDSDHTELVRLRAAQTRCPVGDIKERKKSRGRNKAPVVVPEGVEPSSC